MVHAWRGHSGSGLTPAIDPGYIYPHWCPWLNPDDPVYPARRISGMEPLVESGGLVARGRAGYFCARAREILAGLYVGFGQAGH